MASSGRSLANWNSRLPDLWPTEFAQLGHLGTLLLHIWTGLVHDRRS
jgi:hypothetical protein